MGRFGGAPVSPVSCRESPPDSPSNQSTTSTLSSLTFREFFHVRRTNNGSGSDGIISGVRVKKTNDNNHFESGGDSQAVNTGEFGSAGWDNWGLERSLASKNKGTAPKIFCGSIAADGTELQQEANEFDRKTMCMEKTPKAGVGGKNGIKVGDRIKGCKNGEKAKRDGSEKAFNDDFREKNLHNLSRNQPTFSTSTSKDTMEPPSLRQQGTWDITRSFSFRKGKKEKQKKESRGEDNQQHDSFTDEDREAASLMEMEENDMFALEVGLMFSADDGDTITNYNPSICASLTMESFDGTSSLNVKQQDPSSDLAVFLNQHAHKRNNGNAQDLNGDADSYGQNYIQNPNYIIHHASNQQPLSVSPRSQSTIVDDYGNKIPPNAKMIYNQHERNNQLFPTLIHPQRESAIGGSLVPKNASGGNATNQPNPEQEMERRLREIAGQLSSDWRGANSILAPALARRLRDFQFAREKRRKKYGTVKPWGILGLYDHLAGVRIDVEWAEDAAWRRKHGHPYLTWLDFESTKNEGFNRPFFTFLVVSACTAMMFTSFLVNDWRFEPISVNPMLGPSAETLLRLGAKDSYLIVQESEIWRLVSTMVLHAGLIHYLLNMFALWYVGKAIEQIHGFFPSLVIFVVSAVGGTILSAIFLPEYITVGASGGIFGLIGACISDIVLNWNLLFNEFVNERGARLSHAKVLIVLLFDIIINSLIGLTPFVDNFTHLGGMILGFLCGLSTIQLVSPRFFGDERQYFNRFKLFFFRSFGLIVSMAGIIASSIVLFSGDGETNPCTSCTALSCIAFPPWTDKNDKWWYCDDCSHATAEGTVDTSTGKFVELSISCPNGRSEILQVDESWPQDELGLEGMLPMLCREHCLS